MHENLKLMMGKFDERVEDLVLLVTICLFVVGVNKYSVANLFLCKYSKLKPTGQPLKFWTWYDLNVYHASTYLFETHA